MMQPSDPPPLWREVVGDTEPWRRGRLFLVLLAIFQIVTQALIIGSEMFLGNIERAIALTIGATISWLLFYFIWIGVHWVRWLSAGFSGLVAFAKLIWGVRDGNVIFLVDGTIGFATSAYLGLAPSVFFFAQRQKETIRWKESLAVAAVFALVLTSFGAGIVALLGFKAHAETRAQAFADKTFRRVFVDFDTHFLKNHATDRLMQEVGWERLGRFTTDCYIRVGAAQNLRPATARLRFIFKFPATLIPAGRVTATAEGQDGPVRFFAEIGEAGEWQIDSIWWKYDQPSTVRRR